MSWRPEQLNVATMLDGHERKNPMTHRAWRMRFAVTCALALALGLMWGLERVQAVPLVGAIHVTSTGDGAANPANCPSLTNCRRQRR